ncbi:hypothetical protein GCM10027215_04370 [Nocardioides zeae]
MLPATGAAGVLVVAVLVWADALVPLPVADARLPLWTYLPAVSALAAGGVVAAPLTDAERATPRGGRRVQLLRASVAVVVAHGGLLGAVLVIDPRHVALATAGFTGLLLVAAAVVGRYCWLPVLLAAVGHVLVLASTGPGRALADLGQRPLALLAAQLLVVLGVGTYVLRTGRR